MTVCREISTCSSLFKLCWSGKLFSRIAEMNCLLRNEKLSFSLKSCLKLFLWYISGCWTLHTNRFEWRECTNLACCYEEFTTYNFSKFFFFVQFRNSNARRLLAYVVELDTLSLSSICSKTKECGDLLGYFLHTT